MSIADNQGMIRSLQQRAEYTTCFPSVTLHPDWDLLESIYDTYHHLFPNRHSYLWEKGHQDDKIPYHRLPPSSQFNVDADRLATDYLNGSPTPRPLSPLLPTARCSLRIRNETIHGHYSKAIREATSLPPLFAYLRSTFQWSHDTIKSIQWDWFQLAANNYDQSDNHLMKLIYDQLPTQAHKSKQGGQTWLSPNCRHCNLHLETFDHLLRCDHPLSTKFRRSLPSKVLTYCKSFRLPHNFNTTIVIALEDWVRDRPPLEAVSTSPVVHRLIHSQRQIGWTRFTRGFFSTIWQDYLDYEFHHSPDLSEPPAQFDHARFFSGLIKLIWSLQSDFWMTFQSGFHKPASSSRTPLKTDELKLEIRHLYSLRDQVLAAHRDIYFPQSLSAFLDQSSPSQLYSYISNYKTAIRRSIKAARKQDTHSKAILQFPGFHRTRRTRSTASTSSSSSSSDSSTPSMDPLSLSPASSPPTTSPTPPTTTAPSTLLPQRRLTQMTLHRPAAAYPSLPSAPRERPHHKHSRWKSFLAAQKFRAFFTTGTPNH
jgi:hypothetical protein